MISAETISSFERHPSQSGARLAKWMGEICVILMVCVSITMPPFKIGGLDFYLKTEQLLLPIIIGIYIWMVLTGVTRPIRFNSLILAGAIYSVCIAVSIWYGADLLAQTVLFRDFYEIPKVWLPVLFFTVAYEAELTEAALGRLISFFGLAIAIVCLYAWAQWGNLGITYALNSLYSTGNHDDALFGARRVYSTMGNPNLLGMLMTWSLAVFIMAMLSRAGNRVWYIILGVTCLVTLAMTGSRYGLMTGGFVVLLAFALPSTSRRQRAIQFRFLLLLVPLMALMFYLVATSNQHTLERFQTLRRPLQADSLRERVDGLWLDALAEIKQTPFFGRGPAKSFYKGVITDSEYLDVLKQFGIIGFLPYFAFFLIPLGILWKGLQAMWRAGPSLEERIPLTFATLRLCLVMVVTAIVMNIGSTIFYDVPLQGFFFLWMGIGTRCATSIREAAKTSALPVSVSRQILFDGRAQRDASLGL
jgi:O-antigen ligase